MPERKSIRLEPDPVIEAYKKDVDRTLIQENLKLTVEERLRKLMELQDFAPEMRSAATRIHQDRIRRPDSASR